DVGRVLAGAADIGSMHEGLGAAFERTLSSAWVELWARDAAAAEGWSRSCPAGGGEPLAPPWAGALLPPSRSDVVVANGERGVELLVPLLRQGQVTHVLRIGGERLLLPDRELAAGLQGV